MHRARYGLLFSATALPLGVAAAPNFFPCRLLFYGGHTVSGLWVCSFSVSTSETTILIIPAA